MCRDRHSLGSDPSQVGRFVRRRETRTTENPRARRAALTAPVPRPDPDPVLGKVELTGVVLKGVLTAGAVVSSAEVFGVLLPGELESGAVPLGSESPGVVSTGPSPPGVVSPGVVSPGVVDADVVVTVVVVEVGGAATMLFVICEVHVTRSPPPFAELLHWLIVMGRAELWLDGSTVHRTRIEPPPPLPDPLHCVIVAPLALAVGVHWIVGSVPPPPPDPMHWLRDAGLEVAEPVMLLITETLQITMLPPAFTAPLHCVMELATGSKDVDELVQLIVPTEPRHTLTVTVDEVNPDARSMLFTTVTSHWISRPSTLSMPLH